MSVDWTTTAKTPYLQALTQEIEDPRASHLDTYLRPFIGPQISRETWLQAAGALPGLDGIDAQANMSARYANPEVMASYQEFERRRNYKLD
jgi:cell filamentation protein